ncbi:hypothetical protein GDO78_010626 [Eleutherodactylus coqui]|uniref:Uncharacterized protein n=1 Tax=Eleutherodactylus coqui TaxID=57060 RepID=A0A8J6F693_ELECQ|nr:hypothetical protein GDO78_010626 [Eleutherodactylus coqui]
MDTRISKCQMASGVMSLYNGWSCSRTLRHHLGWGCRTMLSVFCSLHRVTCAIFCSFISFQQISYCFLWTKFLSSSALTFLSHSPLSSCVLTGDVRLRWRFLPLNRIFLAGSPAVRSHPSTVLYFPCVSVSHQPAMS